MKIYKYLSETCNRYFDSFKLFEREGNLCKAIEEFCKNPNKNTAKGVYDAFLYTYRFPGLEEVVEAMHKFEVTASTLIPRQRDHYMHTVNVFLLGVSIFTCNKTVQKAVITSIDYPDRYSTIEEEFLFRWGMTSLFHDIGYPLEIAYKTIHEFSSMMILPNLHCQDDGIVSGHNKREIQRPIAILQFPNIDDILYINALLPSDKCKEEYMKKYPNFRANLPNNIMDALANNISNYFGIASKEVICEKLKKALVSGLEQGLLDHGFYSAIIFLKWHNEAFLKSCWNPAYFYFPIIDAASGIFLHNAYDYVFNVHPFNLGVLNIEKHPLGFLLILCDRIQESDRISYGYTKKGVKFTDCFINFDDNEFVLKLFIALDEDENLARLKIEDMNSSIRKTININAVFKKFNIELHLNKFK